MRGYTEYLVDIFFMPAYTEYLQTNGLVANKTAGHWVLGDGPLDIIYDVSLSHTTTRPQASKQTPARSAPACALSHPAYPFLPLSGLPAHDGPSHQLLPAHVRLEPERGGALRWGCRRDTGLHNMPQGVRQRPPARLLREGQLHALHGQGRHQPGALPLVLLPASSPLVLRPCLPPPRYAACSPPYAPARVLLRSAS